MDAGLSKESKSFVVSLYYLPPRPFQAGDSDGECVILRLERPDLLGDRDLPILTERLRFREASDSSSDGERLRLRSLTGLRENELLGDRRRRRGGVYDLDRDGLGGGELDLSFIAGDMDREMSLRSLLLSLLGDQDLSLLRRGSGDLEPYEGERRRARRGGGDLDRLDDGERRTRRRGGVRERERSGEGERRARRDGGEAERLSDGERRRSREVSRYPPRPRRRPLSGTYMSRSRWGGGDRRLLLKVLTRTYYRSCGQTYGGGDRESRRGGPRSKSLPLPLPLPPRSPPRRSSPRNRPPRPRSNRSGRSGRPERSSLRKESIMSFCSCPSRRRCSAAALDSCAFVNCATDRRV